MTAGTYTYYVECMDADGCSAASRVAVTLTVNPSPSAAPVIADQSICTTEEITNITPAGGTGSTFSIVGPTGTVGPQTAFAHADLAGVGLDNATINTYNFSVTETSDLGCSGPTGTFAVDVTTIAQPSASNNGPVCVLSLIHI